MRLIYLYLFLLMFLCTLAAKIRLVFIFFCENARSSQQAPFDNKAYRVTWKSKVSRMKFTHHIADHALIEHLLTVFVLL